MKVDWRKPDEITKDGWAIFHWNADEERDRETRKRIRRLLIEIQGHA